MADFTLDYTGAQMNTTVKEQLLNALKENETWDDLSGALYAAKLDTVSGRIDYNAFNAGVDFNSNARYPEEPVVIPIQAKHAMLYGAGSVFRPHFHWLQEQAATPNFLLGYKITNYGSSTTKEVDFSNYTFVVATTNVFTYTTGTLAQITKFPEIDTSSLELSGSIDFVLFRDTTNASTLFAGADPVATDVIVKYNDSHVKSNQDGSITEYNKEI